MGPVAAEVMAGMTEDTAVTVVVIEATGVTAEMAQVRNTIFLFVVQSDEKVCYYLVIFIDRREDFNRYPDKGSSSSPPADPPGELHRF